MRTAMFQCTAKQRQSPKITTYNICHGAERSKARYVLLQAALH